MSNQKFNPVKTDRFPGLLKSALSDLKKDLQRLEEQAIKLENQKIEMQNRSLDLAELMDSITKEIAAEAKEAEDRIRGLTRITEPGEKEIICPTIGNPRFDLHQLRSLIFFALGTSVRDAIETKLKTVWPANAIISEKRREKLLEIEDAILENARTKETIFCELELAGIAITRPPNFPVEIILAYKSDGTWEREKLQQIQLRQKTLAIADRDASEDMRMTQIAIQHTENRLRRGEPPDVLQKEIGALRAKYRGIALRREELEKERAAVNKILNDCEEFLASHGADIT